MLEQLRELGEIDAAIAVRVAFIELLREIGKLAQHGLALLKQWLPAEGTTLPGVSVNWKAPVPRLPERRTSFQRQIDIREYLFRSRSSHVDRRVPHRWSRGASGRANEAEGGECRNVSAKDRADFAITSGDVGESFGGNVSCNGAHI